MTEINGFFFEPTRGDDSFNSEDSRDLAIGRCTAIKTLQIPSSVETIGGHAFFLWTGLVNVHLSEGLKKIGSNAFGICSSLSNIQIPSTVEIMGKFAFADCRSLKGVVFADDNNKLQKLQAFVFSNCPSLETINPPPTIQEIGEGAFEECKKLKSIYLPSQLTIIRSGAFQNCSNLRNVQTNVGLLTIEDIAFAECRSLLRIRIPSTVNTIETQAFYQCSGLVEVILENPGRLNAIQWQTFALCSSLESIVIPSTVTWIQDEAFFNCNLKSVEVLRQDNIVKFEADSFACNRHLCNVSLEDSWKISIDPSAMPHHAIGNTRCEVWRGRYKRHPIHKMCHHASTTKVLQLEKAVCLRKLPLRTQKASDARFRTHAIDKFGMTPFHVLLSAAKRRPDLLEVLLREYPLCVLGWKDHELGRRPLDYLLGNWTEEAKEMTRMVVEKWMLDPMTTWGLPKRKRKVSRRLEKLLKADELSFKHKLLNGLYDMFSFYQRMEATSLLEMWLWKMQMHSSRHDRKRALSERESSRHRCCASFAIPIILSFLVIESGDDDSDNGSFDMPDDDNNEDDDDGQDAADVDEGGWLSKAKSKRAYFLDSPDEDSDYSRNERGDDDDSSASEDEVEY